MGIIFPCKSMLANNGLFFLKEIRNDGYSKNVTVQYLHS